MACEKCKQPYPEELLTPVTMGAHRTKPVCGICALEMINEFHGINRTEFQGEIAEDMRQGAILWRKKHGVPL